MPRTAAVATDDFNEATLDAGNWAQLNATFGNIQIFDSTLVGGSHAFAGGDQPAARWIGAGSFNADQWAGIAIAAIIGFNDAYTIGVIIRASADTTTNRDYYYVAVESNGVGTTYTTNLGKLVNGTHTLIHTAAVAWAVTDRVELEAEGTTIRVCKNGTPLGGSFTATDASLASGAPGVIGSGGTNAVTGDNWEAGNFAVAGLAIPIADYHYRHMQRE